MKLISTVQIVTIVCSLLASFNLMSHEKSAKYSLADDRGEVTYLGNEAVMVTLADNKILFDPFFHKDFGFYQLVPKKIKAKIHQGLSPYDGIDLILISHAHADHFTAKEVLAYLEKHQSVNLVGPKQAIQELNALKPSKGVGERLHSIELALKQQASKSIINGIIVEAVRIPHAGWPSRAEIENIVFRVSMSNKTTNQSDNSLNSGLSVMHMGDADPNKSHFDNHQHHWDLRTTDVAFPPYWFYSSAEGQKILSHSINAKRAIGVHVPIKVPDSLKASGVDYFSVPGEKRSISTIERISED